MQVRIIGLAAVVLCAFAANSLLCRAALSEGLIDPSSFTVLRLLSGALVLQLLFGSQTWFASKELRALSTDKESGETRKTEEKSNGATKETSPWLTALALFLYCICFSFAYVSIDAGVGAMILFGSVQVTMLFAAVIKGERLGVWQWLGLALAVGGLAYLMLSGREEVLQSQLFVRADSQNRLVWNSVLVGSVLMFFAGVSWGWYSLAGRGAVSPITLTSQSFVRTQPFCMVLFLATPEDYLQVDLKGLILAILSGGVTSGLGYALWYRVLPSFRRSQAAVSQLLVPVIAGIGGIMFLGEQFSQRLLFGSIVILGGVIIGIFLTPTAAASNDLKTDSTNQEEANESETAR